MAPNSRPPDAPDGLPDRLLGGKLRLWQPDAGHRAGTDAVLLAACLPVDARGRAADIGAGAGAAGLAALLRAPALNMTLIEIDPALSNLADRNIAENNLNSRARSVEADILSSRARAVARLGDGVFDVVLTNPPFHEPGAVRVSPDAQKARAHVGSGGTESWMKAALALLAPGGLFLMVHRADALPKILQGAAGRIGGLRLLPVLPREDRPAVRLLVAGRKASRAPLEILPALVLHGADGRFTPRAEAIHRGEAGIDLGLH